jgi:hypothetical protein
MDAQRITGGFGRRLLWCTLGAMLALSPGTASAAGSSTDACGQTGPTAGYLCQNQTQGAVGYNGSQTQGWAYYCNDPNGVYTNFWPDTDGIAWNNTCFTEAENYVFEGGEKSDANYTNWCVTTQSLVVVLACWNEPSPYLNE